MIPSPLVIPGRSISGSAYFGRVLPARNPGPIPFAHKLFFGDWAPLGLDYSPGRNKRLASPLKILPEIAPR
jgi:hypothetical protein